VHAGRVAYQLALLLQHHHGGPVLLTHLLHVDAVAVLLIVAVGVLRLEEGASSNVEGSADRDVGGGLLLLLLGLQLLLKAHDSLLQELVLLPLLVQVVLQERQGLLEGLDFLRQP